MARKTTSTTPKTTSAAKAKPRRTATGKARSTVTESMPIPAPGVKQRKPIFRAGTWIAVLLLIALIEFAVYFNREKEKAVTDEATPVSETTYIFNAEDGVVSSIEIKPTEGDAVKVARNAENAWAIVLPAEAEADQGLVEAAATQITALRVISTINGNPEIFGLDNPAYIITIEFKDGKKRTLEVGDTTPTNNGYYVSVDKDKIVKSDLRGIDSLLQLAAFPP
jgi:hypothetical protein